MSQVVRVNTASPYDVAVGHGVVAGLGEAVGGAAKVAILHPKVLRERAAELAAGLDAEVTLIQLPKGEKAKTTRVLDGCWQVLADEGFTRSDAVVGLGGGATTDLAGFVAGTWLRGVRYVSVPTTLLAMVDAAVGGKTGINLKAGKNLVGAFWEPKAVLADLDFLTSLPVDDLRGGLAEMAKHGFIADERTLELFETAPDALLRAGSDELTEAVVRSMEVKASVVSGDLRERTSVGDAVGRELLNYGHTLAHAIERRERYTMPHGHAVSIGSQFAALLSANLGHADAGFVERHRSVFGGVGLPLTYEAGVWDELRATMNLDKKSRGGSLRFVLLDDVARPFIAEAPDEGVLADTYDQLTR